MKRAATASGDHCESSDGAVGEQFTQTALFRKSSNSWKKKGLLTISDSLRKFNGIFFFHLERKLALKHFNGDATLNFINNLKIQY